MERRLIASLSGAATLHALLLLGVALSSGRSSPRASREPLVSIDLITLREEPAPVEPEPEPPREAPPTDVVARPPQPAARARRTAAAVLAAKGASEAAIVTEGSTTSGDEIEPGPAPVEGEGSAPINLGLDGSVARWALQVEQQKQRTAAPKDVGGLQSGLLQQDTDSGRGPGFEIAARLLERGRELAPLGSTATAEVVIEPDGRIGSVVLLESTSAAEAWQRVLRDLQQNMPSVRRPPSRRVRAQLSLVSRGSAPSGASGPTTFDLSNIGAAQQHWFHVRVLAQIPD